jgi:hypothetical protein
VTTKRKSPRRKLKRSQMHWPQGSDEKAMRDDLARELLSVCMTALQAYGLDRNKLIEFAREAARNLGQSSNCATEVLAEALQLGEVISRWGEDSAYLDASGRPAVLSVSGRKPSFATLANEYFPKRSVTDIVSLGCRARVIEKVGIGKVAQLNNIVLFTGNSFLQLAHSVRTIRWFLATANFNRHVNPEHVVGWPDREAHVEISEKDFAEFVRIVRPQISGLIEMSNRWLCRHSARNRNPRLKRRVAGIQVFAFRDQ